MPAVLANKIAAGEVVQRPESVVKELVENAIDADAGRIVVLLKQAGIERIQVTDDGRGMSPADANLCFARHATSKIQSIDDLESVATLGFRGEALASIGAVARVRLKTMQPDATAGTEVRHDGGKTRWVGPCATTVGTSVDVRDLFYNVPARRKFLKSEGAELRRVVDLIQQIALSHPDISFRLEHDGREILDLTPDLADTDSEAITSRTGRVFGVDASELVAVSESTSYLAVTGVVGRPRHHRRSRGQQVLIVNGRVVKNRYLEHAIRGAYGDAMDDGDHPLFVLFLDLDPGHVDVNVHPSKGEVKFDDERGVYSFLRTMVARALATADGIPLLTSERESMAAGLTWDSDARNRGKGDGHRFGIPDRADAGTLSSLLFGAPDRAAAYENSASLDRNVDENQVWQVGDRYLLLRLRSGLLIVDQLAAHERVTFERALASLRAGGGFSQQLLFPQTIEMSARHFAAIEDIVSDLRRVGFDLDPFGGTTIVIRGVPAEMAVGNVDTLFADVLERYGETASDPTLKRNERLARSLARCSAARSKRHLAEPEMRSLVDQLFLCDQPRTSPDGQPTIVTLGESEIATWFGS